MRLRWLLILCFVLLLCGYPAHAAKRGDLPTSSGGQADSCVSGTLFYLSLSPVVQLNVLTVQDTNGNSYTVHVDGYDWGELVGCPANHTAPPPGTVLTEDRSAGAHSIFFVYVLGSDGKPVPQLSLNSLEISLILTNPGFAVCTGTDMTLCNLPPSGYPSVIPPPDLLQPAPSPSADGTGTTWSFGPVYDATNQTLIPLNSNYNGHWVTYDGTNYTTYIIGYGTAVLVADGTVQCDSPPAGPCNSVNSSTPFSVAFTPPGSSSVIKASSPSFPVETKAMSAAGHDVESNPIVLSPTSKTSVLDTASNYPQQIISSTTPPTETVVNGPANSTLLCPTLQSTPLQAYRSVWFEFTSPVSTQVYLSTAGSHYDTIMSIAENSDCNDDSDPNNIGVVTSQIPSLLISTSPQEFVATANTPYHILVTEFPPNSQQQDGSSSDGDASYTASLSGDSTLYFTLSTPQLNATPASLKDFGSSTIGKRTAPQTIDLASNTFHFGGTGITNVTAAASGDFQVTPTTCMSPLPDSGLPCSLNVTFTPTVAGKRTGNLTITSSGVTAAENTPIVIALGGTGIPPEPAVGLAPATSLTFPSQTVATHSIVSDVVITNNGTGPLTISNIAATGDFSQTNNCTMAQIAVSASCTVMVTFSPTTSGTRTGTLKITDNAPNSPQQLTLSGVGVTGGLQFVPVTPCRIADTRSAAGAFGGPELAAKASRTFDIPQSNCGIPTTAVAYSLNVTVVPNASLGFLTVWPAGEAQTVVSTLNSDGRVKANAAITPAGTNGGVSVFASDATQFILDIDGYFVPAGTNISGLEFYPLTPCRIADTRNATGPLGGPSLTGGGAGRAFPVQSNACGIPSTAKAYSLNITAVPHGSLGYLTTWPTGQAQPVVSTLNSSTGAVAANAALVPAGSGGEISVFVSDTVDVILDVNGYFAAPATGGLALYTATPCRVLDTRTGPGAFNETLVAPISTSACAPPATAQAYVLNATVVPSGSLGYLTLWPDGSAQPLVSTLNAGDGAVTSNMAVIQTKNGSVDAFATAATNLILDISSYFAP